MDKLTCSDSNYSLSSCCFPRSNRHAAMFQLPPFSRMRLSFAEDTLASNGSLSRYVSGSIPPTDPFRSYPVTLVFLGSANSHKEQILLSLSCALTFRSVMLSVSVCLQCPCNNCHDPLRALGGSAVLQFALDSHRGHCPAPF